MKYFLLATTLVVGPATGFAADAGHVFTRDEINASMADAQATIACVRAERAGYAMHGMGEPLALPSDECARRLSVMRDAR